MGRPFNKSGGRGGGRSSSGERGRGGSGGRGRGGSGGRGRGGSGGRGRGGSGGRGRGGRGGRDRGGSIEQGRGHGRGEGRDNEKRSFNPNQVSKTKRGGFEGPSFHNKMKFGDKKSESIMSFKNGKKFGVKKNSHDSGSDNDDVEDDDEIADMSVDIDSSCDEDGTNEETESMDEIDDTVRPVEKKQTSKQKAISSDSEQSEDESERSVDESDEGSDNSFDADDGEDDEDSAEDESKDLSEASEDNTTAANNKDNVKSSSKTLPNQVQGAVESNSLVSKVDKKILSTQKVATNENPAVIDKKVKKASVPFQPHLNIVEPASEEERAALCAKAFSLAEQLAQQVLFVKPIPRHCTLSQLRQFCREASNVRIPLHESTGRNRGYAFIDFKSREQAERVRNSIHGKLLGGKSVEAHFAGAAGRKQSHVLTVNDYDLQCLFVTGLARDATKAELQDLFPAAERIEMKTTNDKRSVGHCLVFFKGVAAALAALQDTRHRQVKGQCISVTFSKKRDAAARVASQKKEPNVAERSTTQSAVIEAKKVSTTKDVKKMSVKRKAEESSDEENNMKPTKKTAHSSNVVTPLFSSKKKNGKRHLLSTTPESMKKSANLSSS